MLDGYGRTVDYLRLSITESCNYRCRYCMPNTPTCSPSTGASGHKQRELSEFCLPASTCVEIAQAAIHCGIRKIRITGGEPLLRPDLPDICRQIKAISSPNNGLDHGLDELCITTNGSRLAYACKNLSWAQTLRASGVDRLNISLDTLRPERFTAMTRTGTLSDVLDGIAAAEQAGFSNLKINTVLIGGFNDDEILDFIALTKYHPWEIRFIELMPMGPCANWPSDAFVRNQILLDRVPELQPLAPVGVARRYQLPGAWGKIGLISPMSCEFCSECRRIRVTADGYLRSCLHSSVEISLRNLHGPDLEQAIRSGILSKPERHRLNQDQPTSGQISRTQTSRTMNQIGG